MLSFSQFIQEKVIEIEHEVEPKPIRIHHNPTSSVVQKLHSESPNLRGTYSKKHGLFVWNAHDAIHYHVRNALKNQHGYDISGSAHSAGEHHRDFSIYGHDLYVQKNYEDKSDGPRHAHEREQITNHPSLRKLKLNNVQGY